jgi:hypothetical protein
LASTSARHGIATDGPNDPWAAARCFSAERVPNWLKIAAPLPADGNFCTKEVQFRASEPRVVVKARLDPTRPIDSGRGFGEK